MDGKSLAAILRGQAEQVRDTILLAYRDVQRAVLHGRWKLIRYPQINRTQLFDLQTDPEETKDLAADPAQAERIKLLLAQLAAEQKRYDDTLPLEVASPKPAAVDAEFFRNAPPQKPAKAEKAAGKGAKTSKPAKAKQN